MKKFLVLMVLGLGIFSQVYATGGQIVLLKTKINGFNKVVYHFAIQTTDSNGKNTIYSFEATRGIDILTVLSSQVDGKLYHDLLNPVIDSAVLMDTNDEDLYNLASAIGASKYMEFDGSKYRFNRDGGMNCRDAGEQAIVAMREATGANKMEWPAKFANDNFHEALPEINQKSKEFGTAINNGNIDEIASTGKDLVDNVFHHLKQNPETSKAAHNISKNAKKFGKALEKEECIVM